MSYIRVGTYEGERSLQYLVNLLDSVPMQVTATGYEATSNDTELLQRLYKPLLGDLFAGSWSYAMVVLVKPQGHLPVHADGALPVGVRRLHIVMQTNPRCWYYHAGAWEQLEVGGIYELDPTLEHGAINWGAEPRVHLFVDVKER